MAVALQSNSNYTIISQDDSQRDKVMFHIKLTDSCLKTLEKHRHQTAKNSKSSVVEKPSIRFKGKTGSLFIPSKSGKDGTTFNFSGSSLFNETSTAGWDCLQQKKGDMGLILLGNITEKITVSGTNDSYETTRNRMTEVENKRKGNSAKVIELSTSDAAKKSRRTTMPRAKNPFRKLNSNKFVQSSSSLSKGLREKVIHLLALKPLNKLELRLKLERDGVKLKDASVLTNLLQQVAGMQDNQYNLHRHLYTEIQVDTWPSYTDEDREAIKTKLVCEMGTSVERLSPGFLTSGLSTNNSSKRPLAGGANPAGKRQRIAHHNTSVPMKSDTRQSSDKSPPKITSRPPSTNATTIHTKPRKEHSKSNHKTGKTDKNGLGNQKNSKHNNDNNNNNCSETNEDYFIKYPKITTYTQRCSYKEEFMLGYDEYTTIKERSDLVSKEFIKLREKLKDLTKDSDAAQAIRTEILKLYDEKKEEWTKDRKKIDILYPKLNHIKQLVIQYDQAQIVEAKNQGNG